MRGYCIAMCLLVVGEWARSYWRGDYFIWGNLDLRTGIYEVNTGHGMLMFRLNNKRPSNRWDYGTDIADAGDRFSFHDFEGESLPDGSGYQWAGFAYFT